MNDQVQADRRVQRTKRAIFEAFRNLVHTRPYDELRVADIVAAAGIGRSTFYEHYRGKDDVLTDTITWLFEALADAAIGQRDDARLTFVLDHFYAQRNFARVILTGRPLRLLIDRLAELIEARRVERLRARGAAAAQLEMLFNWLGGRVNLSREQVADALTGIAPTSRE